MAQLISTFPALPLTYGATVVFEARDPTTGELVSGVVIVNPVLYGLDLAGNAPATEAAEPVVPLWLPIPTDVLNATEPVG